MGVRLLEGWPLDRLYPEQDFSRSFRGRLRGLRHVSRPDAC